jgi:NADH-quinone oxidoreductase subunit N
MWAPDVYEGGSTAAVLFIGSAPKLATFGFIMRLLVEGLGEMAADWQGMLIILAVMSMAIGNLAAIAQTNIKRMLAYSTISHMGFVLLGILSADGNGYSSAMFYVVVYVLMTLGMFGIIMLLSRAGFEADTLDDFKGLNRRNPWYAFITLLLMFSMAGIPPTVGIYAKLSVLQAVLGAGHIWLAVLAVLLSLIGVFYYLRIVKLMYFDEPTTDVIIEPQQDVKLLLSANGLAILGFGLFPQVLMALCTYAIQQSISG